MTQKNIIIVLLVLVLMLLFFTITSQPGRDLDNNDQYTEIDEDLDEDQEPIDVGESDTPTSTDVTPPGSTPNLPVPEAVVAVRELVAKELAISSAAVIVVSVNENEWPNGCLGLGSADEMCTQALVPGYEVTVTAQGTDLVYRTNIDGSVIRQEK